MTRQQRTPLVVEDVEVPPSDDTPLFLEPAPRPAVTMVRLNHAMLTGVQVLVSEDKAERLIASGDYKAAPDDQQPPPIASSRKQRAENTREHTSIRAGIIAAVEPHQRAAEYGHQ